MPGLRRLRQGLPRQGVPSFHRERAFQLLFLPGLCTDCGLCLKICLAGCLTRVPGEAFSGRHA
jgi:ferredoxin